MGLGRSGDCGAASAYRCREAAVSCVLFCCEEKGWARSGTWAAGVREWGGGGGGKEWGRRRRRRVERAQSPGVVRTEDWREGEDTGCRGFMLFVAFLQKSEYNPKESMIA